MIPHQARAPYDWAAVLRLIQTEFAAMEGRIDPPSSAAHLTVEALAAQAQSGEIWVTGAPPLACMVLTVKPGALYLGKLAVAATARRRGLARALVETAAERARGLGLPVLEVQTRVELVENHATFRALGFAEVARSRHPGYARATSVTFRREV
ncbi:GNAT family N-acetyltransferase [Pseudotabrizicola algicola]|uniref:GNAT family N-acetyltransferase n=1 Tax=Pseudotabrizicola algicola TaxID=2709381 RepID=A0A6B3RIW6_9RHOB|nr:GNAT family N-acetyltransferase [Pseudotabrizicola algicola]NEX45960.1 GNAT family N-acetyltransferase [Pseudotabrizicola algicola]